MQAATASSGAGRWRGAARGAHRPSGGRTLFLDLVGRTANPPAGSRRHARPAPRPARPPRRSAARAVHGPDGLDDDVAAGALLQGMTAQYLSSEAYPVRPGDTVVVHAAAGGVGLLLTQMVKFRGGRVIGTTSSDQKATLAREAGADEVIGYEGFGERVRELTDGVGAAA